LLAVEIRLEGERAEPGDSAIEEYRRELDLRRGLLHRSVNYRTSVGLTTVGFDRFVSIVSPHVAGQAVSVVPRNWRGTVVVEQWIDAREYRAHRCLEVLHAEHLGRHEMLCVSRIPSSRVRVGHAVRTGARVRQAAPPKPVPVCEGGRIGFRYEVHLETGQRAVFERVSTTYTGRDIDVESVERSCLDLLGPRRSPGYGEQRRRHVQGWRRRWQRADILIDGPLEDQRAIRFAVFHLLQSASTFDPTVSVAAKGLSGPGYRGHVFWDTELFVLPFFLATHSRTARRLLEYRYQTLEGARRNAQRAGYGGAMVAWESTLTGDETCPRFVPDPRTGEPVRVLTGEMEHHISADVVYASWLYLRATRDARFRRLRYRELLFETARFWASRATRSSSGEGYEIRGIIGPDEYHENVDNNAFTNSMASWNLAIASEEAGHTRRQRNGGARGQYARSVSPEEVSRWREISSGLVLPSRRSDSVRAQHDGFFELDEADPCALSAVTSGLTEKRRMPQIARSQVLKQADLLMLYLLFPDSFTDGEKEVNFDYYEPRTTHDSSLSPSVHSVVASDLGRSREAYAYFRKSALLDLENTMGNTSAGLHLACLGGTWLSVVRGFLGIRLEEDELRLRVRLPEQWTGMRTQIRHRGQWYTAEVAGERSELRPAPNPPAIGE
jgi:trehalose/maltose hydrolase-like predicted phosphorylase